MDPHENTKSGPGQNHDSPGPQDSARQPEEPGDIKPAEPPRKCKLCGGPNHYGCGCEAKAAADAAPGGQPESEAPAAETQKPAEPTDEEILKVHNYYSWLRESAGMKSLPLSDEPMPGSKEAIAEIIETSFDTAKDIKMMADGFDGLCACMFDTNNFLKVISGDLITIRKILSEKDEVKNDPDKPGENKN